MWWWVLIWVLLVVGAGLAIALTVRMVWRKAVAAGREVASAAGQFDQLSAQASRLQQAAQQFRPTEPAIFADPGEVRAALDRRRRRSRDQRGTARTGRRYRATPGAARRSP